MAYMIQFFLKNGLASRRTLWMAVMSLIPPACTLLLWVLKPHLAAGSGDMSLFDLFPQINYHLYLHFLLPVTAIFTGTAVLRDEIEERTLPYLLTRPRPRWMITAAKMTAGLLTAAVLLIFSLFLSWLIILLEAGFAGRGENTVQIIQSAGVLLLGLSAYIPLFTLLGGAIKRPVLAGLFFIFLWENTVAVFPGNVKLLTIAHYLHVLSPPIQKIDGSAQSKLLNFIIPANTTGNITAFLVLFACIAVFTVAAAALLYVKEYRLEQE